MMYLSLYVSTVYQLFHDHEDNHVDDADELLLLRTSSTDCASLHDEEQALSHSQEFRGNAKSRPIPLAFMRFHPPTPTHKNRPPMNGPRCGNGNKSDSPPTPPQPPCNSESHDHNWPRLSPDREPPGGAPEHPLLNTVKCTFSCVLPRRITCDRNESFRPHHHKSLQEELHYV